jgi:hypothetical protein
MFRVVPLPVIRSPLTVHLALVCVIRFEGSFQAGPGCWKLSSNRMTYTSAKCTVNGLLMKGSETTRNM